MFERQKIKGNMDSEDPIYIVLEGNKDSLGNWVRGHFVMILQRITAFCFYLERSDEVKFVMNYSVQ